MIRRFVKGIVRAARVAALFFVAIVLVRFSFIYLVATVISG